MQKGTEPARGTGAQGSLDRIQELYLAIRPSLDRVERILKEELRSEFPYIDELLDHLNRFAGKRIRPALLLFTASMTGPLREHHFKLAACVEMLHSATLVHDDVLDEAVLRRRIPTINRVWDNEQAIIFGDFVFAKTFTLISRLDDPETFRTMSETARRICTGELLQLSKKFNPDMDEAEYLRMIDLKTASLFDASCRLGLSGQEVHPAQARRLGEFGRNLGMAFQIVDDCLDITGEENVMGKSLGTDIVKGKITLPVLRLLRSLPAKEAEEVRRLVREQDHAVEKREIIADRLRQTDVLASCEATARDYVWSAKKALRSALNGVDASALHEIADFVVDRIR